MKHTGLRQVSLAQQREGIGPRCTGMHDHRFAGLARGLQVQAKRCLLQLGRFRLVVVVQAGFADRHNMRVRQLTQQPLQRRGLARRQVQWMHPHRAVDIGVLFTQGLDRPGVVGTDANAQKMPDPAFARSLQGSIERALVGTQVKTVKVAMGIYEHGITAHMNKRESQRAPGNCCQ